MRAVDVISDPGAAAVALDPVRAGSSPSSARRRPPRRWPSGWA
ncbi:hypothetical protein [Modestobacter marinus]|nr:hypothetical protein [Modestobacter marinus]